jgi:extracellular matrix regulatory protein B
MFLHVGADVVVSLKRVVAIFDLKSSQMAEATRNFITLAHQGKKVTDIAGGEAKSLVLTDSEIYLSPISSLTLMKRADFLNSDLMLDLDASSN